MFKEFKTFIMRGNVLDLAVAVIIGAAFGKIVTSLTDDIIMPMIGKMFGGLDFSSYFVVLNAGKGAAGARRIDRLCRAQEGRRAAARLWRVRHPGGQFRDRRLHHLPDDPRGEPADAEARGRRRPPSPPTSTLLREISDELKADRARHVSSLRPRPDPRRWHRPGWCRRGSARSRRARASSRGGSRSSPRPCNRCSGDRRCG